MRSVIIIREEIPAYLDGEIRMALVCKHLFGVSVGKIDTNNSARIIDIGRDESISSSCKLLRKRLRNREHKNREHRRCHEHPRPPIRAELRSLEKTRFGGAAFPIKKRKNHWRIFGGSCSQLNNN